MDGIELLRRIKEKHADTEVIMMTGHADLDLAVRSLQHDAADFITKPINYAALEVALKRVHEKLWMRAKLREYTEDLERLVEAKSQQLIEAERMAAIGQTVATIAHGVKNIIGGLTGGMYVLERGIELLRPQVPPPGLANDQAQRPENQESHDGSAALCERSGTGL